MAKRFTAAKGRRPDENGADLLQLFDLSSLFPKPQPARRRWWPDDAVDKEEPGERNTALTGISDIFDSIGNLFLDPLQLQQQDPPPLQPPSGKKKKKEEELPPPTPPSGRGRARKVQKVEWATSKGAAPNRAEAYHRLSVRSPIFFDPNLAAFAVYDGHTEANAAEYCSRNVLDTVLQSLPDAEQAQQPQDRSTLIMKALERVANACQSEASMHGWRGGTTGVVMLFDGKELVVVSVGDTRAVLGRRREGFSKGSRRWMRLTEDHSPMNSREVERIGKRGGRVAQSEASNTGCAGSMWRMFGSCRSSKIGRRRRKDDRPLLVFPGGLRVTRSIGDMALKKESPGVVISDAESETHRITASDAFVVVGSRELWADLSEEDVCRVVEESESAGTDSAEALVAKVRSLGNQEYVTVLVLHFDVQPEPEPEPKPKPKPKPKVLEEPSDASPRKSILKSEASRAFKQTKSGVRFASEVSTMAVMPVTPTTKVTMPVRKPVASRGRGEPATPNTMAFLNAQRPPPAVDYFDWYSEYLLDEEEPDERPSSVHAELPEVKRTHRRNPRSKKQRKKMAPPTTPPSPTRRSRSKNSKMGPPSTTPPSPRRRRPTNSPQSGRSAAYTSRW